MSKICCVEIKMSIKLAYLDLWCCPQTVPQHGAQNETELSCSKLKMSLVNISLKFGTLISEICQYV